MDTDLIRARLAADPSHAPAEAIAAPASSDDASDLIRPPLVAAAVLVPILHGAKPGILLTKRTSHLKAHAGQVAFPGGRIDPTDASIEDAADATGRVRALCGWSGCTAPTAACELSTSSPKPATRGEPFTLKKE